MKPYQQISMDFGFSEPESPAPAPAQAPAPVPARAAKPAAAQEPLVKAIPVQDGSSPLVKKSESTIVVLPPAPSPQQAPEEKESALNGNPVTTAKPLTAAPPIVAAKPDLTVSPAATAEKKKPGRKQKEKVWKSTGTGKRGRKSLKEIAQEAELVEIPDDASLFAKQYYSIGEVANMFRMNPSLIRTWTNEFEGMLQPRKNRKGDRFYRPDDVKLLHLIYHLIRVRKFTLEGAREHLKSQKKKTEKQFAVIQSLQQFRAFLLELRANL